MTNTEITPEEYAGDALRVLRGAYGLTQALIAKEMTERGHSWVQTTCAKTELGQRPLRVNELVSLAALLQVSLDDMVDPELTEGAAAAIERIRRDRQRFRQEIARAQIAARRTREELLREADRDWELMQKAAGDAAGEPGA